MADHRNGSTADISYPSIDSVRNEEEKFTNQDMELSEAEVKSRELNELPVDRGWAWVICFATFLAYVFMTLPTQVMQVMFLEVIDLHNVSITAGSLMFTCGVVSLSISTVVAVNFVMPRIGVRIVVISGGIGQTIASIGFFWAPNFYVLLAFACLKGGSLGCVLVPAISIIRHYFHARLSLANNICSSGICIAVMIFPPIIRYVRNEYGIRNTFLIFAAVELHMVVAGMLLRPASRYKYRPKLAPLKRLGFDGKERAANEFEIVKDEERKQSQANNTEKNKPDEDSAEYDPLNATDGHKDSTTNSSKVNQDNENIQTHTKIQAKKNVCSRLCSDTVLSLWTMRLLLIYTVPTTVNFYLKSYIPTISKTQGATLDEAAIVLALSGFMDLVSNIGVGVFADLHILRPSQITMIGCVLTGIACQCLRFFNTFPLLLLLGAILGFLQGIRQCMAPLLAQEVAGFERMPQALSFYNFVVAITTSIMNPMFGSIAQANGDFIVVAHILGVCLIAGSLLLCGLPLMERLDKKSQVQQQHQMI